ncbi:MAG: PIN domain-containing protein [Caldilineales bacterium]|nr:PIN domain-containing protein [Caldilineales bacterium]
MSNVFVLDTHTLFWHLAEPKKLSAAAKQVFEEARQGQATLILSPIILLELFAVVRKLDAPIDFKAELARFERAPFRIEPITTADLRLLEQLDAIPELHDKLIGATTIRLQAKVVTRDLEIRNCASVESVW